MSERPTALITGASRGIGRGIAEKLAKAGFDPVINYRANSEAAEEVAFACRELGASPLTIPADVAIAADRRRLIEETWEHFGRLDLLVNNAGITSPGRHDLLELTEEGWDQVFATNLKGPFFLSQLAAHKMITAVQEGVQPGGVIVNISSISAIAGSTNRADYCMAKAAMRMMTELFAVRLADEGIRVYEVCPGVIESDMTAPVREHYEARIHDGLSPIRRWGRPEDVAEVVALLATGHFSFSTGDRFFVDGGFHIRRL